MGVRNVPRHAVGRRRIPWPTMCRWLRPPTPGRTYSATAPAPPAGQSITKVISGTNCRRIPAPPTLHHNLCDCITTRNNPRPPRRPDARPWHGPAGATPHAGRPWALPVPGRLQPAGTASKVVVYRQEEVDSHSRLQKRHCARASPAENGGWGRSDPQRGIPLRHKNGLRKDTKTRRKKDKEQAEAQLATDSL